MGSTIKNFLRMLSIFGLAEKETPADNDIVLIEDSEDSYEKKKVRLSDLGVSDIVPTGTVLDFAGSTAPSGYLVCDGSAVSRTTYSALFTVISTTYGAGDGSTTFNVPNAKGRTTIGVGQGSTYANGVDSTGTDFALADSGGMEKHVLITAELAAHTHTVGVGSNTSNTGRLAQASDVAGTHTSSSAGSNTAHNNLQPYLVLNKIIKT